MDRNAVFSIVILTKAQVHSVPSAALGTIGRHSLAPKESAKVLIGWAIQVQFIPSHVHATALRTRMHSSRMRTVCSSIRLFSRGVPGLGGGGCLLQGGAWSWGVCPGGCLLEAGVCLVPEGGLLRRVLLWGVFCSRGFLLPGVAVVSKHALRQIPPPCEQNERQV